MLFCFYAGSSAHFVDSGSVTLHICEQAHESRMASLHRLYGSSDILPPFSRLGISVSASDADVIDEVMPAAVGAHLGLVYRNPLPFAELPEDRADLQPLQAAELLPPVLRGEHDAMLTVPARMR